MILKHALNLPMVKVLFNSDSAYSEFKEADMSRYFLFVAAHESRHHSFIRFWNLPMEAAILDWFSFFYFYVCVKMHQIYQVRTYFF